MLPYTNTTKQILVAAFRKSVNDNGQVQLLSVQVRILADYLLLHQMTIFCWIKSGRTRPLRPACVPSTEQCTSLLSDHCGFHNSCLSVRLSIRLYIRPSACLSDWYVCVYSSCPSRRLSIGLSVCQNTHLPVCWSLSIVSVWCTGASNYCHRLPHNCLQCLLLFFSQEAASERQQCDSYLWLHHVSRCGVHLPVYL